MPPQDNQAQPGSPPSSPDSPQPEDRLGELNKQFEGTVKKEKVYEEFRKNLFGKQPKNDQDSGGTTEGEPEESRKRPSAKRKQVSAKPGQTEEQKDVAGQGADKDPEEGDDKEEPKAKTERQSAVLARIAKAEAASKKRIEKEMARLQEHKQSIAQDMQAVDYVKQSIQMMHDGDINSGLKRLGQIAGIDTSYEGLTSAMISGKMQKSRPDEEQAYINQLQGHITQLEQRLAGLENRFVQTHEEAHEARVEGYWAQASSVLESPEMKHARHYAQSNGLELSELLGHFFGQVVQETKMLPSPDEAARMLEEKIKEYNSSVRALFDDLPARTGPPPKRMYEPFSADESSGGVGTLQVPEDLASDTSDEGMRKRARLALQMIRQGKMPT